MKQKKSLLACGVALMGAASALSAAEITKTTTVSGNTTVTQTSTPTAWATTTETTETTSESTSEFSANIGVTSNYLWRGVSQTDDGPAVSGGVDWAHESGFYLGTWISNINWGDDDGAEVDFYGGFSGAYQEFGYDVGLIYYYYPSTGFEDSNFLELAVSGTWKWFSAGINYTLTGDADDDAPYSAGDIYYHIGASYEFLETWSIGATVGYYDFDTSSAWEAMNGDGDYTHGQIDLTKSAGDWGDFTLTVSKAEPHSGDGDDYKFLVSWAKSF